MNDPIQPGTTHSRSKESKESRAYIVLLLGVLGMGFSGIFVSLAGAPGAVAGVYRTGIACIVLAIPFVLNFQHRPWPLPREVAIAMLAGAFFAADLFFWNTGILISGATNPTLMGNTAPIWVGLGSVIFFHERPNRPFWVGLFIALAGAAVILGADVLNNIGLGTFFGLLSGMFYGGYFLVLQRSRQNLDTLSSFWLSSLSSAVCLIIMARILNQPLTGYSQQTYLSLVGLALIVQVGGQMTANFALGYLPASVVAPILLLQPVLTGLLAVPLLGETLTVVQIFGGAIVLAGIYLVHRSRLVPKPLSAA